jgi:hypothetical protein
VRLFARQQWNVELSISTGVNHDHSGTDSSARIQDRNRMAPGFLLAAAVNAVLPDKVGL